jgi:hypothetical protein
VGVRIYGSVCIGQEGVWIGAGSSVACGGEGRVSGASRVVGAEDGEGRGKAVGWGFGNARGLGRREVCMWLVER